jgi:hypothetical protein
LMGLKGGISRIFIPLDKNNRSNHRLRIYDESQVLF